MARKEQRTERTLLANISDGKRVYEGIVVDVSRDGLKMRDIPERFDFYAEKYTAVISHQSHNFKFFLGPRWSKARGAGKEVGFKIISPPLDWIRFINALLGEEVAIKPALY